ncbi:uncharacterized protein [Pocillopora verrucosa]|uniref:uncharacterized protein n=1 Tax=Pocillopora verrucosa TaxID=203993 RepID=UPI00334265C9
MLYSRRDHQHHKGLAIILKKDLEECLLEWKPIKSRVIKVRFKERQINTTIIQCYTPTNDSEDKNQIDHLIINGIWRRSLPDARVRRGAPAGSDNNTTLKLELRNTISSRSGGQHSDVEKLRDLKVKTAFILQLQNKFQVLADAEDQTLEGSRDTNKKW